MKKYTIYLGLSDRTHKQQFITTNYAKKLVADGFKACTITECFGSYTNLRNERTTENTLKIEIIDFDNNIDIEHKIQNLGVIFNQESIAYQVEEINSKLVYIEHKIAA